MIGAASAALVAELAFWAIVGLGVAFGELGLRGAVVSLVFWSVGVFGLSRLSPMGGAYVTPYVAVLDIVLAFIVFKGDVRLS